MKIKSLVIVAVLSITILGFGFVANAQTTDVQALIAQIQAQIAQLLAQIQALQAQQSNQTWCHAFNSNIGYANSGFAEVGQLHTALDKQGISYSTDTGNAYGEPTMGAVIQFQQKYSISPLSGYVGPLTRAKLNSLYGCGTQSSNQFISFTSPVAGDHWAIGTTQTIKWTATGTPDTDSINITVVGPSSATVSNILASSGSYAFTVPVNFQPGTYNVKISDLTTGFTVTSGAVYIIAQPNNQFISFNSPVAGDRWAIGSSQTIRWTATDTSVTDSMTITISGSSTFTANIPANSSSYVFTVPTTFQAGTYNVKIADLTTGFTTTSGAVYIVASASQQAITVTSPVGGETWKLGETHNITWTGNTTGNVSITAVSDPFVNTGIVNIATNITNTGSYSWSIPYSFPAYAYHIEILTPGSEGGWATAGKSNRFTVASPTSQPTITITSPMNLETWKIGEAHRITWTSSGVNKVSIDLVTSCGTCANGIKLVSVASNISASAGTYSWTIPSTVTPGSFPNGYVIQISDQDVGYAGIKSSNAPTLNIVAANYTQPTITITLPNGGTFSPGQQLNIAWTASGANNVMIELEKDNPSEGWTLTYSVPASQGSYSWTIPTTGYNLPPTGSDYRIKIWDTTNTATTTSSNYFTIASQ